MKRVKRAFRADEAEYKVFKDSLRRLLRGLKAETGVSRPAEAEEEAQARRDRVRALLTDVHGLFSPPSLSELPCALEPLLPREWRQEWSLTLAAHKRRGVGAPDTF